MAYGRQPKARRYRGITHTTFQQLRARLCLWLVLLWGVLASLTAIAAPTLQLQDNSVSIDITSYIDILEDPGGRQTIEQITSPPFDEQFTQLPTDQLILGFTPSAYWLRFNIVNTRTGPSPLLLRLFPPNTDEIDLFCLDPETGQITELQRSGMKRPFQESKLAQPYYYYSLPVKPQRKVSFFLRLKSSKNLNANITLLDTPTALSEQTQINWWLGIFFGIIGILILINIGQRIITKNPDYLWYSGYLLAFILNMAFWLGYLNPYLADQHQLIDLSLTLFLYLAILFYCQFSRSYFHTAKLLPRWDLYLQTLSCITVLALFTAPFSSLLFAAALLGILVLISALSFFTLGIYTLINGTERAQIYTVSRLIITPAILALTFGLFQFLPWSTYFYWLLMCTLCIEAMITTYSLIQFSVDSVHLRLQKHYTSTLNHTIKRTYSNTLRKISHEIRTPISGVIDMSELLLDTSLSRNQRDQVLTISSSGKALLKWLKRLDDWSALQSGKLIFDYLPFELPTLIKEFVEDFREQAQDRHVELKLELDPRLPPLVKGDPERIKQILSGIFDHALYYSEQGQFTLNVKPAGPKDFWLFQLVDSQSGLQPEEIEPIAEEVNENSTKMSAVQRDWIIAQQLARHMSGEIKVDIDGRGHACYRCKLLISRHTLLQHSEADYDKLLRGKRLLIVDNSVTSRKVMSKRADRWGMRVSIAPSGKEAMAMIRTIVDLGYHYDLIILDHELPGMSGLELAEKISSDPALKENTTIIMLSGASTAPGSDIAINAGIRRVLSKPITTKTLKITLAEELTLSQTRRPIEEH